MLEEKRKTILFIGHNASLSGAPVLLMNLLMLLKEDTDFKILVVLRRGGYLTATYKKYFPVIVLKRETYKKNRYLIGRLADALKSRCQLIRVLRNVLKSDIVFSNTIVNGRLLKILSPFGKKTITYVHELEEVIESYMSTGDSANSLKFSNIFAFPSSKVKDILQSRYKISDDRLVRLSYYFPVDVSVLNDIAAIGEFRKEFREKYNLDEKFLVGGAGVLCKRKGTDLFIEVCRRVQKVNKDIRFCWIGQFENSEAKNEIMRLIEDRNLQESIVLTGPLPHHNYNFCVFDLFFLSSREDPYPLVVPEAAFMKVPSLCFEESGGITEFVDNDAGWIIPGMNVNLAAERILYLAEHREEIAAKGNAAFRKVVARHSDKKNILGQFNDLINHI